MGKEERLQRAEVAWLVVAGRNGESALAGNPPIEQLLAGVPENDLLERRQTLLWLGSPFDCPRRLASFDVFYATQDDVEQQALRAVKHVERAGARVKIVICATLCFREQSWWVCVWSGAARRMFPLLPLLSQLAPVDKATPCDVIVPASRWWGGRATVTSVDFPDRAALAEWQKRLREEHRDVTCWFAARAFDREDSSPDTQGLVGVSAPTLDDLAAGFTTVADERGIPRLGARSVVLLLGSANDPKRWLDRLGAYLRAVAMSASPLDASIEPTADGAILCVLQDSALSERVDLHDRLEEWRRAGAALVLLDRVTAPSIDEGRRWRLAPAYRGSHRALDQALWLRRSLPADPPSLICDDPEGVRQSIATALESLASDRRFHCVFDHVPMLTRADFGGSSEDLAIRVSMILSRLGIEESLGHPEREGEWLMDDRLETLLRGWDQLRRGVPVDPVRRPPEILRPIDVRLTYSSPRLAGTFTWLGGKDIRLRAAWLSSPAEAAIEPCDAWLHAAEGPASLLPAPLASQASGQMLFVQAALDPTAKTDWEVARELQDGLERGLRPHHVFLSYTVSDRDFVLDLAQALERSGIRCVLDPRDATGSVLRVQLQQAIRGCQALVAVLSHAASKSTWVQEEIAIALEHETAEGLVVVHPISLDGPGPWAHCRELHGRGIDRDRKVLCFDRRTRAGDFASALAELVRGLVAAGVQPRPDWVNATGAKEQA